MRGTKFPLAGGSKAYGGPWGEPGTGYGMLTARARVSERLLVRNVPVLDEIPGAEQGDDVWPIELSVAGPLRFSFDRSCDASSISAKPSEREPVTS